MWPENAHMHYDLITGGGCGQRIRVGVLPISLNKPLHRWHLEVVMTSSSAADVCWEGRGEGRGGEGRLGEERGGESEEGKEDKFSN